MPTRFSPPPERQRAILRREIGVFLAHLRTPKEGWAGVPDELLAEAFADAVEDISRAHANGFTHLLIAELQDRITSHT